VVNSCQCTIGKGAKCPWASDAAPPPSPLVRRSFELALLPHSHSPTLTDHTSVRGADARIGAIEVATSA